jgi:hypothetical protein
MVPIAAAAATLALAACAPPTPPMPPPPAQQPPFAVAPSDSAVEQAMIARIVMADEPFPAPPGRPPQSDDPPTPCSALFTVQSVSVTQQPVSNGVSSRPIVAAVLPPPPHAIEVDATWHATRIAADPDTPGPQRSTQADCFNADATNDWAVGQSVVFHATTTITYTGPYWMLVDGDVHIPLASGPPHPFTVKIVAQKQ